MEQTATISIQGRIYTISPSQFSVNGDAINLSGTIIPPTPIQSSCRGNREIVMRNYMFKSSLIKFRINGMLATGAITHCTDKAWRVLNLHYGAAWIPKNIIEWSEISQQFCVTDSTYTPKFTTSITKSMREYPHIFNPETLVVEELNY